MSIEKFAENMQKDENLGNHDKMVLHAAEIFLGYDFDELAKKMDLKIDEEYLYIDMLTRHYRISRKDAVVTWYGSPEETTTALYGDEDLEERDDLSKVSDAKTWNKAGFNEAMTIYDLIAFSRPGAKASLEYTQIHNLADTVTGSYYAGKGIVSEYAQMFEGKEKELAKGCELLGGEPYGRGDVSYRVPFFRDLAFVISYWAPDDEFPPQVILMTDMNMKDFLHYETIWYLQGHIMHMIRLKSGMRRIS